MDAFHEASHTNTLLNLSFSGQNSATPTKIEQKLSYSPTFLRYCEILLRDPEKNDEKILRSLKSAANYQTTLCLLTSEKVTPQCCLTFRLIRLTPNFFWVQLNISVTYLPTVVFFSLGITSS